MYGMKKKLNRKIELLFYDNIKGNQTTNMTSSLITLRDEYIELNREIMSGTSIGGHIYNTCLNEINKTETGLNDDMLLDAYEEKLETDEINYWIEKRPDEIKKIRQAEIARLLAIPASEFNTYYMTDCDTLEDFEVDEKTIKIRRVSDGEDDIELVKKYWLKSSERT